MSKLIVDVKEKNSKLLKELKKRELDYEIKNLIYADFVIYGKNDSKKLFKIGIERKTQNDFINSIIDKRIITQLTGLKEQYDKQLLIIEGQDNIFDVRNFHPNAIRGMISSIILDFNIPIIYSKSLADTISFISIISKRLDKPRRNISLLRKRKPLTLKEQKEYIIEALPGIGPTIAKSLLKKFKTVKKVLNASEGKLKKVEKIGEKKAKYIKQITESKY